MVIIIHTEEKKMASRRNRSNQNQNLSIVTDGQGKGTKVQKPELANVDWAEQFFKDFPELTAEALAKLDPDKFLEILQAKIGPDLQKAQKGEFDSQSPWDKLWDFLESDHPLRSCLLPKVVGNNWYTSKRKEAKVVSANLWAANVFDLVTSLFFFGRQYVFGAALVLLFLGRNGFASSKNKNVQRIFYGMTFVMALLSAMGIANSFAGRQLAEKRAKEVTFPELKARVEESLSLWTVKHLGADFADVQSEKERLEALLKKGYNDGAYVSLFGRDPFHKSTTEETRWLAYRGDEVPNNQKDAFRLIGHIGGKAPLSSFPILHQYQIIGRELATQRPTPWVQLTQSQGLKNPDGSGRDLQLGSRLWLLCGADKTCAASEYRVGSDGKVEGFGNLDGKLSVVQPENMVFLFKNHILLFFFTIAGGAFSLWWSFAAAKGASDLENGPAKKSIAYSNLPEAGEAMSHLLDILTQGMPETVVAGYRMVSEYDTGSDQVVEKQVPVEKPNPAVTCLDVIFSMAAMDRKVHNAIVTSLKEEYTQRQNP